MYAILEAGSKQYKVSAGDRITVEKMDQEAGSEAVLRKVLMIYDKELHLGTPYIKEAGVVCDVIETFKGPKITIFKYKRRKGSRRKRGHRQLYTTLKIKKIELKASKAAGTAAKKAAPKATATVAKKKATPTKKTIKKATKKK